MEELSQILETLSGILNYELIKTKRITISFYSVLTILLIAVVAKIGVFGFKKFIDSTAKKSQNIDKGKAYTLTQLVKYFTYTFAVLFAIESLGVNISILIASSAALFVGIGLGLQNIFNDIVSGIFLLFERSIAVGDVVEINKLVGQVKEINVRTSRIRTRDGIMIIVPNSKLVSDNIINWSTENNQTRFIVEVGVAYGSNTR